MASLTSKLSFPAESSSNAETLILGSMPGEVSLQQHQYYAHPRNVFWKVMAELFDFDAALGYSQRLVRLKQHKVALWDVLQSCERIGSLDSNIVKQTEVANDFVSFFKQHKQLKRICFNGGKARDAFNKHVLTQHPQYKQQFDFHALPSTSPAHAAMNYETKLSHWRKALFDA